MECGVEPLHGLWVVTVDVEFVGHGEVTQGLLEHERRWLLSSPGRAAATRSIASTCRHGVS